MLHVKFANTKPFSFSFSFLGIALPNREKARKYVTQKCQNLSDDFKPFPRQCHTHYHKMTQPMALENTWFVAISPLKMRISPRIPSKTGAGYAKMCMIFATLKHPMLLEFGVCPKPPEHKNRWPSIRPSSLISIFFCVPFPSLLVSLARTPKGETLENWLGIEKYSVYILSFTYELFALIHRHALLTIYAHLYNLALSILLLSKNHENDSYTFYEPAHE